MQKLVLYSTLAFSLALIVFACSKDKFETKPTLKIQDISPNPLPKNSVPLVIDLEYTDKEGDLATDSAIFVRKIRINKKKVGKTLRDSFWLPLPGDVPKKTKGSIRLTLDFETYAKSADDPGNPPAPDSLIFRFSMRDKANHASDTVESGLVIIER